MSRRTGGYAPGRQRRRAPHRSASIIGLLLLPLVSGCAAVVPLEQAGSLSSYQGLADSNGFLTRAKVSVSKDEVLAAKTARIVPTSVSATETDPQLSETQRRLIANVVERSLCIGLSDRFEIVAQGQPADLTVHAVITRIVPTDETAAGLSKVTSIATSVATGAGVVPVPVPRLRIPVGLGGLALEAEAIDPTGRQKAAMIWARGADTLTSRPRVSPAGDAYDLASSFGNDFSKLLVTGSDPFRAAPSMPSMQRVQSMLGGAPKQKACEAFGREAGVTGLVGGAIGLPPEWTDKGAQTEAQQ